MGSSTILRYHHTKLEQFLFFGSDLPIFRVALTKELDVHAVRIAFVETATTDKNDGEAGMREGGGGRGSQAIPRKLRFLFRSVVRRRFMRQFNYRVNVQ